MTAVPDEVVARMRVSPDLTAAGHARRALAPVLRENGFAELAEDVLLTVGELVTNAVLHARTDIDLVVLRVGRGVRVEVGDGAPTPLTLPPPPPAFTGGDEDPDLDQLLAQQTTTGRGLRMVAALADAWGMEGRDGGKTVWAELGTGAPRGNGAARDNGVGTVAEPLSPPSPDVRLYPVRLLGVPLRLGLESDNNLDDLIREFQVVALADGDEGAGIPARLVELIREVLDRYARQRGGIRDSVRQAVALGQRLIDLDTAVPKEAVPDLWHLTSVLDEVARYCRDGALLSLAPSDELTAFRRWFVAEVERQVGGAPPRPCPFPVLPPDDPKAVAAAVEADLLLAERSARVAAEEAAARLSALQSVAGALTGAVDSDQVAEVVLVEGVAALGGHRGSLCLLRPDGETVEIVHQVGYTDEVTRHWRTFAVSDDLPASEAIRTGGILVLRTLAERNVRYPIFTKTPVLQDPAFAVVPLTHEPGLPFGALVINFAEERDFGPTDRSYLEALGTLTAQAFERARLHDAEATARERLAFLAEATAVLNRSLDPDDTLAALAACAVPRLGDWCAVHLLDDAGAPVLVTAAHSDAEKRRLAWELFTRWPVRYGTTSAVARCLLTGEPILFQVVPEEMLEATARDADHLTTLKALGFGSGMVVPLQAGGRVVGAMSLANELGRIVSEDDYSLAQDLAGRAGAAIANAKLFEEQSRVARSLQASLLPVSLPRIVGLELGARYVAAGEGLEVGGDFYDVFAVRDGWVVAIGDVCGKGVEAAAVTGVARHTIRALAPSEGLPSAVLRRLNDVLLQARGGEDEGGGASEPRFCTVAMATVRRTDDGVRLRMSSGGHPLPFVRRADGRVDRPVVRGDVLGVLDEVELTDTTMDLGPGDCLVLFTDGISERHEGGRFFDEDGVLATLGEVDGLDADTVAARLERNARAFVATDLSDDMAVLVLRVPPTTTGGPPPPG